MRTAAAIRGLRKLRDAGTLGAEVIVPVSSGRVSLRITIDHDDVERLGDLAEQCDIWGLRLSAADLLRLLCEGIQREIDTASSNSYSVFKPL